MLISFGLTFASSSFFSKYAQELNLLDEPAGRKVHREDKPIGGLSLFIGLIPIAGWYMERPLPFIIGASVAACVGTIDDKLKLGAWPKLLIHVIAAVPIIFMTRLPAISFDFFGEINYVLEPPLSYLIFFIWIVGIINAINLIDGLDGLASGISFISLLSFLFIAISSNGELYLIGGLLGGLLGFLYFNCYPARLFLGDGGSYLLGFSLAYISVFAFGSPDSEGFGFIPVVVILMLPILDTAWAILRRALNSDGIFSSDRNHIHHKALDAFGHEKAVFFLLLTQLTLSSIGLLYFHFFG